MMNWLVWILLQQSPGGAMLVGGGWMDHREVAPSMENLLRDDGFTGPTEIRGTDLWLGGYAGQVYLGLRFIHPRVDLSRNTRHARVEYPAWMLEVGELYTFGKGLQWVLGALVGAGEVRWTLGEGATDVPLDTLLNRYTLNRAQAFRGLLGLFTQVMLWMPTGGGGSFAGLYARAGYVMDVLQRPMRLADGTAVVGMPDVRYRGFQLSAGVVFRGSDLSATPTPYGGEVP